MALQKQKIGTDENNLNRNNYWASTLVQSESNLLDQSGNFYKIIFLIKLTNI